MPDSNRIPIAWPVRWRRIRHRIVPVACFLVAILLSGWLWEHQGGSVHGVGEVEARRVDVTSPTSGVVSDFPKPDGRKWRTLDHVQAGDVLVRLTPLSAAGEGLQPEPTEILAPLTGTIVAMHSAPGHAVAPGTRLATIVDDAASHVTSYLPEESRLSVEPGLPVTLRSRSSPPQRIVTRIESVGRQIESVPTHQIASATQPQWGVPIRIRLPASCSLRPGSLVDVVISARAGR
jgi:multidrug resistance efflux pump